MIKILFLIFVGIILYYIARSYKTEEFKNINIDKKQHFKGDLLEHEAGLLIALMAKVAKADGQVGELEAELLSHTFTDIASHFENSEYVRNELKKIYEIEKQSFENTIIISQKYLKLTRFDYNKRLLLLNYLVNLAFIDGEFSDSERMIIEDIAHTLEIKVNDLFQTINYFQNLHREQTKYKTDNLDSAYIVLGASKDDTIEEIKQKYKKLVRIYHPDIVTGQGGDKQSIEEATQKLQEINQAYETIKKDRGF